MLGYVYILHLPFQISNHIYNSNPDYSRSCIEQIENLIIVLFGVSIRERKEYYKQNVPITLFNCLFEIAQVDASKKDIPEGLKIPTSSKLFI